ncbi:MAG: hypothetical protein KKG62_00120, partial [Actinobacteria bacterium]|nr:hypothetical protein [Actinomycetota bacterium]
MNKENVLQLFDKHYGDRYKAYPSSVKSEDNNYFFLVKNHQKKYLAVVGKPKEVKKFESNTPEEKKN